MPAQQRVLEDNSRLLTMCCSRRAGKTAVLARMIAVAVEECGFNEWVIFGAKTLSIAKDIMWAELHALNNRFALGWKVNDSDLSITTRRGGRLRLFGASNKESLDKARGKKYRMVVLDEASTYEDIIEQLVKNDFDPGTKDVDGRIILSGTPGYIKDGYWFESSQGLLKGWSNHHWTIRDNPHMGDVEAKLAETREMFGYDEDDPTYICEYLGIWADNSSLLVCDWLDPRNGLDALPADYSLTWRHVIGIDYGYEDSMAWVVVAVNPYDDHRYVVHHYEENHMVGDAPVELTRELVERYKTSYVVSDPAGGGKGFYETFNAKYAKKMGCWISSANKIDKIGSIRLLNGELRTGRLHVLRNECGGLIRDIRRLLWKDHRKQDVIEGIKFPDHGFDALRYALLETVTWKAKDKPPQQDAATLAESVARAARAKRAAQKSRKDWFDR
jgi:hypothetical protein